MKTACSISFAVLVKLKTLVKVASLAAKTLLIRPSSRFLEIFGGLRPMDPYAVVVCLIAHTFWQRHTAPVDLWLVWALPSVSSVEVVIRASFSMWPFARVIPRQRKLQVAWHNGTSKSVNCASQLSLARLFSQSYLAPRWSTWSTWWRARPTVTSVSSKVQKWYNGQTFTLSWNRHR